MIAPLWSPLALEDLVSIDDYWWQHSPRRADEVLDIIKAAGQFLATTPKAGSAVRDDHVRKWRVRRTEYLLIYRIVEADVEILRVRHGRENWRPPE